MINTHAFPAAAASLWILGAFSVATWALILIKAIQHLRNGFANRSFAKTVLGCGRACRPLRISRERRRAAL